MLHPLDFKVSVPASYVLSLSLSLGVCIVACSTNMSIQDADCLGRCLAAQPDDPVAALHKYQEERIPQTSQEVQIYAFLLACPGEHH